MENNKKNNYNVITVFGARGKVGIELLKSLSQKGIYCRAITRNLNNVPSVPYVNWLVGDLTDKSSVYNLIAGSNAIFLNTDFSPDMAQLQSNVIEIAKSARIPKIVLISYGVLPDDVLVGANSPVHNQHIEVEKVLAASGLDWTIIRPSAFMQNWLQDLAPTIISENKFYEGTGEGKLAYIDTRDLAEICAEFLLSSSIEHIHKTYEITGSEAVSFYQVAEAISKATGSSITFQNESEGETRERLSKKGYPEWAVNLVLYFAKSQFENKIAAISPVFEKLTGRSSRSIYDFASDYATFFKTAP
jgi:NAD(P)H dehydrogenase (quinone)